MVAIRRARSGRAHLVSRSCALRLPTRSQRLAARLRLPPSSTVYKRAIDARIIRRLCGCRHGNAPRGEHRGGNDRDQSGEAGHGSEQAKRTGIWGRNSDSSTESDGYPETRAVVHQRPGTRLPANVTTPRRAHQDGLRSRSTIAEDGSLSGQAPPAAQIKVIYRETRSCAPCRSHDKRKPRSKCGFAH
jgi:hypothetical protein